MDEENDLRVKVRKGGSAILHWFHSSDIPYLLLLTIATLLAFFPLLLQDRILSGDERLDGYYQYSLFYSEALKNGESFLWNPHSYGGFPTYVNQFGAFLFPPVLLVFSFLPPFFAFHFIIATAFFVGLFFSYLFGRAFFLSRQASLLLALSYAILQLPATFHLGLSYVHSFLVLPLILYALIKAKRSEKPAPFWAYMSLGAVGVATGLLAGYFVTLAYALIIAGFFALAIDWFPRRFEVGQNWNATLALTCMGIIGLIAATPQLIPLYEYSAFTSRTADFAREMAVGSEVKILDFARFVIPHHFQYPLDPGRGYFYMGLLPLFCTFAALIFTRTIIVRFFAFIYLVFLAFAMNLPVAEWVNINVPPFSRIGGVSRWLLPGGFALAFLAAYGFDHLGEFKSRPSFLRYWKIFRNAAFAILGGLLVLPLALRYVASSEDLKYWILAFVLRTKNVEVSSLAQPVPHYIEVIGRELSALNAMFSISNPHVLVFSALFIGALIAIHALIHSHRVFESRMFAITIVFLVFLTTFMGGLGNTIPRSLYFSEEPKVVEAIRKQEGDARDFRFISIRGDAVSRALNDAPNETAEELALLMRELLYREVGTAYGLRNIIGFEPIRSIRQNQLIDTVLLPHADAALDVDAVRSGASIDDYVNAQAIKKVSTEGKADDVENRISLLSMMNVKYIVSVYPLEDERLREIEFERFPLLHAEYYLYENTSVLPRLYFAKDPLMWSEGSDRELFLEMVQVADFNERTYIECRDCDFPTSYDPRSSIEILDEGNGYVTALTESGTGAWVVWSESDLPGWIAKIDGVRVPIRTANYLFQAIYVPEGRHEIEFRHVGSFRLFLERAGLRKL